MDILISDKWLREFLKTDAKPSKIAECLSLCGPSVEKVAKSGNDYLYTIEVTTNRVDTASVYGIAREASVILPRFGVKATLNKLNIKPSKFTQKVPYLKARVDTNLCGRFAAVLINDVNVTSSPKWLGERLELVGERAINNVVDISNYLMHELGQPVHTFDYDKIQGAKMILRESNKGEVVTTLDGKTHKLSGGDIVIEDGSGKLIDLAGIMGCANSAVDTNTKNVLLFVQTYNPVRIRQTSMTLAHRTLASELFEKGLDTEAVTPTILRGIKLIEELTKGKAEKQILDIHPSPYKPKAVSISNDFINKILGVEIAEQEIDSILTSLGFGVQRKKNTINVKVPSWRARDINIPEDLVEEVARIYGYHRLPSKLMTGSLPDFPADSPFEFEMKIKSTLKGFGATEIFTLSLVAEKDVEGSALKLKNPLGSDFQYLRTSLMPSLTQAANDNSHIKEPFHLFEIANVYIPRKNDTPEECMKLGGILANYDYRIAKGFVEGLLKELRVNYEVKPVDSKNYLPSQRIVFAHSTNVIGELGVLENNGLLYYEFDVQKLRTLHSPIAKFVPIPKYPPQIEDITLILPPKTRIGGVLGEISKVSKLVKNVELKDTFNSNYTFRIWYQHPTKTLTDTEVANTRNKILKAIESKFGGKLSS